MKTVYSNAPQMFSYIHGVAPSAVPSICFLNDLSVKIMSLFSFHKKKTQDL